jgi:hypothetical protein
MSYDKKRLNSLIASGIVKYPSVLSPSLEEKCKHGFEFQQKLIGQACIINLTNIICETEQNNELIPILVMKATTAGLCSCEKHYQGDSENLLNVNNVILITYSAISYLTLNWAYGGTLHQFAQIIFDTIFYTRYTS